MAEKVIKSEDIAQSDIFKDMRDSAAQTIPVMKELSTMLGSFLNQTKEQVKANPLGSAQDINSMTSAYNTATSAAQAKLKVDKEILEQEAKLSTVLNEKTGKMNDNLVELAKLRLANEEARKQAKELAKEELGLNSEYQKQSKTLNDLRKQYKDLALQNKGNTQEAKALLQQITSLDKKLKDVDATVGQHQRSVGNYSDAMKGLPAPIQAVFEGINKLGSGFGIAGAAIAVVVSIFARFEPLVEWFERKFAALGAAWTVVSNAVINFGEGLANFFSDDRTKGLEQMSTAFDGMGENMVKAAKAAELLKGELQALENAQSLVNLKAAEYSRQAAQFDKQSRDRTKTFEERIALLNKALDFEKAAFEEQYYQDEALYNNKKKLIESTYNLTSAEVDNAIHSEAWAEDLRNKYGDIGKKIDELRAMEVGLTNQRKQASNFEETRINKINKLYEQQAQLRQKMADDEVKRLEKEDAEIEKLYQELLSDIEATEKAEKEAAEKAKKQAKEDAKDALGQAKEDKKAEFEWEKEQDEMIAKWSDEQDKEAAKKKEAVAKARIEREKAVFTQLEQISNTRYANEEKRLDRTIANSQRQQQTLALLAQNGVDNAKESLAAEQKIQADAEAKRAELQKKKERTEFALTVLKMTTANLEANQGDPAKALIDTGVQVGALIALIQGLPSFFVGTEDTGSGGGLDGKGGFLAINHPHEKIFNAEDSKLIGFEKSNREVAQTMALVNAGLMPQVAYMPNYNSTQSSDVVKELREVKDAIKQIEIPVQSWAYDATEKAIIERVETRNKVITNHIKPKAGIWS